ncbi:MAG: proteinase inhibitor I4 serpin [Deltaproteobacteria bacterium]|nr:proteinase inhibitor I4 serpin [Deltaproteobacteria bacterium]
MVPHVLRLPAQDDESAFRVELMVGRTVQVDERDQHFFSGRIQAETIKGRGYARYTGNKLGMIAGTRMAVDPTAAKVSRFFTRGGEPYLIPCNSLLPVVVYVPECAEVRYRIWVAGKETQIMEKG